MTTLDKSFIGTCLVCLVFTLCCMVSVMRGK
jgi:hypothetical protein